VIRVQTLATDAKSRQSYHSGAGLEGLTPQLTGKYAKGVPPDSRAAIKGYEWLAERVLEPTRLAKVQSLVPIAEELGCTLAQMSLAWCLANPNVSTVITGASRPSQVVENMRALDIVPRLSPDVMARIETATK